jgi:hypothetical protein
METEKYRSDLLGHSGLGGSASGTGDLAQQALDVVRDLVVSIPVILVTAVEKPFLGRRLYECVARAFEHEATPPP